VENIKLKEMKLLFIRVYN